MGQPMASSEGALVGGTLFVAHGCPALPEGDIPAHKFLTRLGQALPRPKAILCVSAHWETTEPCLTATKTPETLTEFDGVVSPVQTKYKNPGDPFLARRAAELLQIAGIKVTLNYTRGIDHAVWDPLGFMCPAADVPVVELSVQPAKSTAHHYKVGQALAPLTKEGYLMVGSGLAVRNRRFASAKAEGAASPQMWAEAFDDWLRNTLLEGRYDDVIDYRSKAPFANLAHPTPEHTLPLIVALGAAGPQPRAHAINTGFSFASISQACFYFQCQSESPETLDSDPVLQMLGANALPLSRLVSANLSKRVPVQRTKSGRKTLASSRPNQMLVSEAHIEALQRCVMEQNQTDRNAEKSPLIERLETVIAAKRTPKVGFLTHSVSLVRKTSGLSNQVEKPSVATPQQQLLESIRAQRFRRDGVVVPTLEPFVRRGLINDTPIAPDWGVDGVGGKRQPTQQFQDVQEPSSSNNLALLRKVASFSRGANQPGSAERQPYFSRLTRGLSGAAGYTETVVPSSAVDPRALLDENRLPLSHRINVQTNADPTSVMNSAQGACCSSCRGTGMQLPAVNGHPLFEPSNPVGVNQGSDQCLQGPDRSNQNSDSSEKVHRALEALFSQPESVELAPPQTSGFSGIDQHLSLERLWGEQQLSAAGFEDSADWCLGVKAPRMLSGGKNEKPRIGSFVPQEGESGHEGMAGIELRGFEGFGRQEEAALGGAFGEDVLRGVAESGVLSTRVRGGEHLEAQRGGELQQRPEEGSFHQQQDVAMLGSTGGGDHEQPFSITAEQESAADAMLAGVSQPDWLWASFAAQESAADAMLAGVSQPDWSWTNLCGFEL